MTPPSSFETAKNARAAAVRDVTCRLFQDTNEMAAAGGARWAAYAQQRAQGTLHSHPGWLAVLAKGLRHEPYCVEAMADGHVVGLLPLCYVRSLLFGRFLVSLPYLNTGGVLADDEDIARALIDHAVELADQLKVRYLELRHEQPIEHPALTKTLTSKIHMRLALPDPSEQLWKDFAPKVRNQIRKGEKAELAVHWGGLELLDEFYAVFAQNMRDLGTPVFGRRLFKSILLQFQDMLCVVRYKGRPIAGGLLVYGSRVTEVPGASSLRSYNATNANMLMHWHFLQRAIAQGQRVFDFGRSSRNSNIPFQMTVGRRTPAGRLAVLRTRGKCQRYAIGEWQVRPPRAHLASAAGARDALARAGDHSWSTMRRTQHLYWPTKGDRRLCDA